MRSATPTTSRPSSLRLCTYFLALLCVGGLALSSCKPQYVRGSEKEELDEYAMSLRLDKKDINKMYDEIAGKLLSSSIANQWKRTAATGTAPAVATFPMHNGTSQSLNTETILQKFQTDLVNQTPVQVVTLEERPQILADIKRQQSSAYNPKRIAQYGRQIGAQFYVTGKIYGSQEAVRGERRQQYFMFIQVLNVETGGIEFQAEANVTKGYVK